MMKRKDAIINKKLEKSLKEYYFNYYNGNFHRDFRFIPDNQNKYRDVFNAKKLMMRQKADVKALNFLTKDEHNFGKDGLIGGEISYFKSTPEYKTGNIAQRYSDRLFFDIDIIDYRVDIIKDKIKNAYAELKGRELNKRLDELKKDFQDLIFNSDLIIPTFTEAKKLCLYLEDMGLRPYLIFSGAKGFHCNCFYDECRLINLSQVSKLFAKTFSNKLNLKYLDWRVFDKKKAQRRLQRCQYLYNSKTDLLTIPIPEVYDFDEVLSIIKKGNRKPIDFDFEYYSSKSGELRESLINNDKEFSRINARKERDKAEAEKKRRMMNKKKFGKDYKDFKDISMVDLYSYYGGEIIKEFSDKAIVRCLFHGTDNHPSGVIFKDSNYFYCSSCGKSLNYYGMISEMEGTDDKAEIMEIASQFLS